MPSGDLESLDPYERSDIKSYATRALVPYVKDDERPSFSGAQGAVYRATRTTTYGLLRRARVEAFAIKEIRLEDIKARERLRNEIKHLKLCDHPNVLRLREAYTIEQEQWVDTTFLVTEPWAQTSLQRFLRAVANDGRSSSCPWYIPQHLYPWPSIVKQCILGVKHLHENSIKHKDLKPDNILLLDESNGDYLHPKVRPIIADLGISKEYVVGARTTFQGTYQYLAPEQIAEEASTLESDVFSLGCCFAWIHSVLSSKPWEKNKQHEQGLFQLDELVGRGFANTAGEIPSLLERSRMEQKGPKGPDTLEFLIAMEEMIAKMLIANLDERAKLESLLERLDTCAYRCSLFKKKKILFSALEWPNLLPLTFVSQVEKYGVPDLDPVSLVELRKRLSYSSAYWRAERLSSVHLTPVSQTENYGLPVLEPVSPVELRNRLSYSSAYGGGI